MRFALNFTPQEFQAKTFTPPISPNFNSFSKKKHKKWVKMEKFTPLEKNFYTVAGSDGNDKSHLCVWTLPPCGHPHQVRGRKLGARYGKVARLSNRNTCQKVLWINPATNISFPLITPETVGFKPMTPGTRIKRSNHSAVRLGKSTQPDTDFGSKFCSRFVY